MEMILNKNLIVDEKEAIEEMFYKQTESVLDWEEMINFITDNESSSIFYFDEALKKCTEDNPKSLYVWIDTGYGSNEEPVFISLVNRCGYYSGHFIGTGKFLCNGMCNRNPSMANKFRCNFQLFQKKYIKVAVKDRIPYQIIDGNGVRKGENITVASEPEMAKEIISLTPKSQFSEEYDTHKLSAVTEEIFDNLLFPVWKSIDGLDTYVKVIGRRVAQLIDKGKDKNFLFNHIGSTVINTGLMDIFGNDIYVIYRKHMKMDSYVAYKVIKGKRDYVEEGFPKEQNYDHIKPICFFEKDEFLRARMEEFDINMQCLNHIVEERKDRLPSKFQNESADYISRIIIDSLEQGLKIQERDPSYARPIYSDGKVSWLLPLRLGTKMSEEPELVMVIRKVDDFFELKTIMKYDDTMKDRITATGLYRKSW